MSPEHAALVRESWSLASRDLDAFVRRFYRELFDRRPTAAALFEGVDMDAQRKKLAHMLDALVRVADEPYRLVRESVPGGRRHAWYGVGAEDYEAGGAALLAAFAAELGDRFTPAMRAAWRELYALLAAVMQRAGGAGAAVG